MIVLIMNSINLIRRYTMNKSQWLEYLRSEYETRTKEFIKAHGNADVRKGYAMGRSIPGQFQIQQKYVAGLRTLRDLGLSMGFKEGELFEIPEDIPEPNSLSLDK